MIRRITKPATTGITTISEVSVSTVGGFLVSICSMCANIEMVTSGFSSSAA